MSKLNLVFKSDKFPDLLQKMEDLSKIGDIIKIKIDQENILIYSMLGESIILAFKNYLLTTEDYIKGNLPDQVLNIIIPNSKKFVRSLSFIKLDSDIKSEIEYKIEDDSIQARFVQIKSGKLKISTGCGENMEIKDIPKEALLQKLNLKNKKWSFNVVRSDFSDIKKLSSINSEGKILHLNSTNGEVILSETSLWEISVDKIDDSENRHLIISKSYLSNIDDSEDEVSFHVFESFLLVKNDISHLMISFEQSFED